MPIPGVGSSGSRDEVGQLAETLDEMQRRLRVLDSARREFIANASHELRTPIASLGGFVELLEDDDPDPETRREFVRTMREQVDRLTKLSTDLLDLSRLDAEAMSLRLDSFALDTLAREVVGEFAAAAERHGAAVSILTVGGQEQIVRADRARTAQIIRILIDNAIKHTPKGTEISLTTSSRPGAHRVSVTDDGPGIDPRSRERVFDRFFTGDSTGGSGLGLAIARELARLMGGDVELETRRRRTTFTLGLPGRGDRRVSFARRIRGSGLAAGAASLTLALGVAACGGDDPETTSASGGERTKGETPTVAINTATPGFDAQQLYEQDSQSVVTILSIFGDPENAIASAQAGQGSGFVINTEGEIVTNAHVVTDAVETGAQAAGDINAADEVYVEFGDRNQVPAEIVGFDPNADIALIKVEPDGLDLDPIEFGDSEAVEVGTPVAAIGSPFGQEQSLSTGIVSATDR